MSTLSSNMLIPYPMLVSFYSSTTGTTTGAGTTNPYGVHPCCSYFWFSMLCFLFCMSLFCVLFTLLPVPLDCSYTIAPPVFSNVYLVGFAIFRFYVMFCRSLFVLLPFLFWPLYCLSFFDLWLLVTLFSIFKRYYREVLF